MEYNLDIQQVTDYVREHVDAHMTLDEAARRAHISRSHFCRIIKRETGFTFTKYKNYLRIEQSKQYLCQTNISIAQVAFAVGYMDQNYYTRVFKRFVGMTPTKYRMKATIQ